MRKAWGLGLLGLASGLLLSGAASARDLFTLGLAVDGEVATIGTNRLREVPDLFDTDSLVKLFPGYTPVSDVTAGVDIRGLPARIDFQGNALRLQVGGAGLDLLFDGGSRDASVQQFQDWLEGQGGGPGSFGKAFTSLVQALVEYSPVDPVAGNPNSLESRMFAADWNMGTRGPVFSGSAGGSEVENLFSASLAGGSYDAGPWSVYSVDLWLNEAVNWDRVSLLLDLPITATATEGAWTGMGSGGLGLQLRPLPWWALTPALRFGGVGSIDVGGLALMYSGTLTSQIRIPLGPLALGITNMGGLAKTVDGIEFDGLEFSYHLTNWAVRNGGYLEGSLGSVEVLGGQLGWRLSGSDVRFFGDALYMDSYFELGASLGSWGRVGAGPFERVSLGVSYLGGRSYDGIQLAFGGRF